MTQRDQRIVTLLSELVACPSVNPGSSGSLEPPYGEGRMTELLRRRLEGLGARVRLQEVRPGRANLIAHWPGVDRTRSLMLEAHTDTVSVEGMTGDPFAPRIEGGRLYGRGACDTKGPMTAILIAIEEALHSGTPLPTDLYFVATCDEEHGAGGAYALARSGFRADAAVVGEPTEMAIVYATKGVIRWRITTHGKAAHSSMPEEGVNAIYHMMRVIEAVNGPLAQRWGGREHPSLGRPKWSVGTIRGGSQVNVVPAECMIELDRRLLPAETREDVTAELMAEMERLRRETPDFRATVEETEYYPALDQPTTSAIARAAEDACRRALGAARFAVAPFGSDAGFFHQAGIPSILFGPGSLQQAHKAVEFIDLADVARAVDVYGGILRRFAEIAR